MAAPWPRLFFGRGCAMIDAIQQFRLAVIERGIIPPVNLLADGRLHRRDIVARQNDWPMPFAEGRS